MYQVCGKEEEYSCDEDALNERYGDDNETTELKQLKHLEKDPLQVSYSQNTVGHVYCQDPVGGSCSQDSLYSGHSESQDLVGGSCSQNVEVGSYSQVYFQTGSPSSTIQEEMADFQRVDIDESNMYPHNIEKDKLDLYNLKDLTSEHITNEHEEAKGNECDLVFPINPVEDGKSICESDCLESVQMSPRSTSRLATWISNLSNQIEKEKQRIRGQTGTYSFNTTLKPAMAFSDDEDNGDDQPTGISSPIVSQDDKPVGISSSIVNQDNDQPAGILSPIVNQDGNKHAGISSPIVSQDDDQPIGISSPVSLSTQRNPMELNRSNAKISDKDKKRRSSHIPKTATNGHFTNFEGRDLFEVGLMRHRQAGNCIKDIPFPDPAKVGRQGINKQYFKLTETTKQKITVDSDGCRTVDTIHTVETSENVAGGPGGAVWKLVGMLLLVFFGVLGAFLLELYGVVDLLPARCSTQ